MKKITPILIVLGLLSVISWLTAINGLFINGGGGNSLGGGIALFFAIVFTLLLKLERTIVKNSKASAKSIWIIESIIVLALLLFLFMIFRNGIG